MKRFIMVVTLIAMSVVSMVGIGQIAWEDREAIGEELNHLSDYADEKFDEAVEFVNEKVELVLRKG